VLNLIEEMSLRKVSLVHGDFSPKNILAEGDRVTLMISRSFTLRPVIRCSLLSEFALLGWFYQPTLRSERETTA
jgi:hypothetical protein